MRSFLMRAAINNFAQWGLSDTQTATALHAKLGSFAFMTTVARASPHPKTMKKNTRIKAPACRSQLRQDGWRHGPKSDAALRPQTANDGLQPISGRPIAAERPEAIRRPALAGVEPRFECLNGEDPVAFIYSANLSRRDLTQSRSCSRKRGRA